MELNHFAFNSKCMLSILIFYSNIHFFSHFLLQLFTTYIFFFHIYFSIRWQITQFEYGYYYIGCQVEPFQIQWNYRKETDSQSINNSPQTIALFFFKQKQNGFELRTVDKNKRLTEKNECIHKSVERKKIRESKSNKIKTFYFMHAKLLNGAQV